MAKSLFFSFFFLSFDHLLNAFFTHSQCDPPLMVRDLLAEVRDGQVLMALLEQLSGCKLVRIVFKCGISLMPVYKVSGTVHSKKIIIMSKKKMNSFQVKIPTSPG